MLAIAGGKGGCGKTTTALGLARALATGGDRPLVVDADCDMPNLHTMSGTDRAPGAGAVADGVPIARARHRSDTLGVDVVPAGDTTGALADGPLRRLARQPGPALVDCPAGATEAVAAPLRVADAAIVVSTARRESLADAAKTARMARALDARPVGAVVARADGSPSLDGPGGGALRAECPVLATVPEVDGDPLASPVGRAAYERLADRVHERNV